MKLARTARRHTGILILQDCLPGCPGALRVAVQSVILEMAPTPGNGIFRSRGWSAVFRVRSKMRDAGTWTQNHEWVFETLKDTMDADENVASIDFMMRAAIRGIADWVSPQKAAA